MRILFTSLNCLADPSSGAAISVRTILSMLAARGHQVMSITAANFDNAPFATESEMLRWLKFAAHADSTWTRQDAGITHLCLPAGHTKLSRLTPAQIAHVTQAALGPALAFAPDLVVSFGGSHFEMTLRHKLQDQGAKVAFYLANPNYRTQDAFVGADVVLTDSAATQDLYQQRLGLVSTVIGKFIQRPNVTPQAGKSLITFVNPAYEKGVTLFFRILEMMKHLLPSARFMVVESRGTLDKVEAETGIPFSSFNSVRRIGLQMDMADVFSRTKILLLPSLWHESGSRTAIEALSLGIPVLASNHGGQPEHLGAGASLINVPMELRQNPRLIPPTSAALPWAAMLADLCRDPEFYREKSEAALAQWALHDPRQRLADLDALLQRLIQR